MMIASRNQTVIILQPSPFSRNSHISSEVLENLSMIDKVIESTKESGSRYVRKSQSALFTFGWILDERAANEDDASTNDYGSSLS